MDLLDRFFAQLSTLQAVWMPFVVALAVAGLAIWKAMTWRYSSIIERLRVEVEFLERAVARGTHQLISPPAPSTQLAATLSPTVSVHTESEEPQEREFLPSSLTLQDISEQRKGLTGIQADRHAASYVGKWIRVKGTVTRTGTSGNELYVSISTVKGVDLREMFATQATLWFPPGAEEVASLMVDDEIEAQGKIQDASTLGFILVDCEALKVLG